MALAALAAFALSLFATTDEATAQNRCAWEVTGRLVAEMRHGPTQAAFGADAALANVRVRVQARARTIGNNFGTWRRWGPRDLETDANGDFTVAMERNCRDRQFRVQVRFENDDIKMIRGPGRRTNETVWYMAHNDVVAGNTRTNADITIDLGDLRFGRNEPFQRGQFTPRSHAGMWVLARATVEHLAGMANRFAFRRQLRIRYPFDGTLDRALGGDARASFVSPIGFEQRRTVNIVRFARQAGGMEDHWDLSASGPDTLLHEIGHFWAYDVSQGENCLFTALVALGDTHVLMPTPCPAFHEGFAEWFSEALMTDILGEAATLPDTRDQISTGWGEPLPTIDVAERRDNAWTSWLHTLTLDNIRRYDFHEAGEAGAPSTIDLLPAVPAESDGCVEQPDIGTRQVLQIFLRHPNRGQPRFLRQNQLRLTPFLERAVDILPQLTDSHHAAFMALMDPQGTLEASSLFCD
jgi:hypothetical protein